MNDEVRHCIDFTLIANEYTTYGLVHKEKYISLINELGIDIMPCFLHYHTCPTTLSGPHIAKLVDSSMEDRDD